MQQRTALHSNHSHQTASPFNGSPLCLSCLSSALSLHVACFIVKNISLLAEQPRLKACSSTRKERSRSRQGNSIGGKGTVAVQADRKTALGFDTVLGFELEKSNDRHGRKAAAGRSGYWAHLMRGARRRLAAETHSAEAAVSGCEPRLTCGRPCPSSSCCRSGWPAWTAAWRAEQRPPRQQQACPRQLAPREQGRPRQQVPPQRAQQGPPWAPQQVQRAPQRPGQPPPAAAASQRRHQCPAAVPRPRRQRARAAPWDGARAESRWAVVMKTVGHGRAIGSWAWRQ